MFWNDNHTGKKLSQMNELLKKSFANVKKDTTNIFQWVNYFYRKSIEQEQAIRKLQLELSYSPKTREEIRRIIDDYYSFEGMMAKIRELNEKIDEISRKHIAEKAAQAVPAASKVPEAVDLAPIERRLDRLEQRKTSIREKIMKRLTRNSKDYVKGIMASYIKKYGSISALQLKEIIVDEQGFCSKSSFYRLLEEVEQMEGIGVIRQGKEKHYMSKAVKQI